MKVTQKDTDWIDVTYPIKSGMVHWPGQPPVSYTRLNELDKGDSANVSALHLSLHTGTHMDAPKHFLKGEADITTAPVGAMMGALRVARVKGVSGIGEAEIRAYESRLGKLNVGERIFFRTDNSETDWLEQPFNKQYVAVEPDGARYLVSCGVQVVGVDYLSVAPFRDPTETHEVLLGNGVWVIEGLDLRTLQEGDYDVLALPLKLETGDASPLRVLVRCKSEPAA